MNKAISASLVKLVDALTEALREVPGTLRETRRFLRYQRKPSLGAPAVAGDKTESPEAMFERVAKEGEAEEFAFAELAEKFDRNGSEKVRIVEKTLQWPDDKPSPVGFTATLLTHNDEPYSILIDGIGSAHPGSVRWESLPASDQEAVPAEEVHRWVRLTGSTPEWAARHTGAVWPSGAVSLVYRAGVPVRVDGIVGAPVASPDGLTWEEDTRPSGSLNSAVAPSLNSP